MTCETTFTHRAVQKAQALVANGHSFAPQAPAPCRSRTLLVTTRNTLVFMPPHRPLSVVTTMTPAFFASLVHLHERMRVSQDRLAQVGGNVADLSL